MIGLLTLLAMAGALLAALLTGVLVWDMRHPPRRAAGYAMAHHMAVDPADLGLAFETWPLEFPGGGQSPVWDVKPRHAITSEEVSSPSLTAVLLHGWGHGKIHSLELVRPLLPHCTRLLLYDLRGHGESLGCTSRLGHREGADLIHLLHDAGDHHPAAVSTTNGSHAESQERFILVGHSMGAVIALAAAAGLASADDPLASRIAGIIAYGPYMSFHGSLCGRLRVSGYPTRPMTDLALLWHRLTGIVPQSLDESMLRLVTCPVLVVHETEDEVSSPEDGRRIAASLPQGALHTVDGAAHVNGHRVNSAEHDRVIDAFLRGLRTPHASNALALAEPRARG